METRRQNEKTWLLSGWRCSAPLIVDKKNQPASFHIKSKGGFYVGKTGTGILQIILTFCFGIGYIWALIDLIIILCGNFKDKEGLLISDWDPKY